MENGNELTGPPEVHNVLMGRNANGGLEILRTDRGNLLVTNPPGPDEKVLLQVASTNTLTDVYTVTTSTKAKITQIVVCNRNNAADTFRLSIARLGAGDATKQYLFYDVSIAANATNIVNLEIPLYATDVVRFKSSGTNLTLTLIGQETRL